MRYQHKYWQTVKQSQREKFNEECTRENQPIRPSLDGKTVLPIRRAPRIHAKPENTAR